jgi:cysteine desulfurase
MGIFSMRTVFLDHQSTTPVLPEVLEAMQPFFLEHYGNPSSQHRHGIAARDALEEARAQFSALINARSPEEILFTSCGTEATNLAVKGFAYANQRRGRHIVVSAIEHPAVLNSIEFLESQGFECTRVGVDREGMVDPEEVRSAITGQTILVCVHHSNHEIGTIEPIREIASVADEKGVPLFVDAVASAGWLPIDVQSMGISLLSLAPHRFYGPKGVGVLYRNRRARIASLIHGGNQEHGRRAGTENVPAIVGGGTAARLATTDLPERIRVTGEFQIKLWEKLRANIPHLSLNGPQPGPGRITTNLNISAEFTEGEGLLLSLDMAGFAVASGTACLSKAIKVSPVLEAIGLDRSLAQASIVVSLGKDHNEDELASFVETFKKTAGKLRNMSPMWEEFEKGRIRSVAGNPPA